MNLLVEKNYQSRLKGKYSLAFIGHPLQSALHLWCLWKQEVSFSFQQEIWDIEPDEILCFAFLNVRAILKYSFINNIYRSSFLVILVTISLIKNAIQALVLSYRNERSIHEQYFIYK